VNYSTKRGTSFFSFRAEEPRMDATTERAAADFSLVVARFPEHAHRADGRRSLLPVALAAVVPLIPVFSTQIPLEQIVAKLLPPLLGI
jgi:hypothetical protein